MSKPEEIFLLYLDDSGARDPDRKYEGHPNGHDLFALGGFVICESDTDTARAAILSFRDRWPEIKDSPLRSYDIRNKRNGFRWLADASATKRAEFLSDLTAMIIELPIYALACVVDRQGYNQRYVKKYGQRRWRLCKTAFTIAVERAAKLAVSRNARLKVYVERSDKITEQHMRGYYAEMKTHGHPFDAANSKQYAPLDAGDLNRTLYGFEIKTKKSLLMQIADVVLWPLCMSSHNPDYPPYAALRDAGSLFEALCTQKNGLLGTKYFCFDGEEVGR